MGEFDEISYSKASKNTTQLAEMSNYPHRKRIALSGTGKEETDYIMDLILHYGTPIGDDTNNDVFLNFACKPDFSDIMFTDEFGRNIPYYRRTFANSEVVFDNKRIGMGNNLVKNGRIYASGVAGYRGSVVVSEDNGHGYKVLYTSVNQRLYPVFIDSRGYIYIQDGYMLKRSTDDGKTFNTVLDMTSVSGFIQDYGVTEDAQGNIYLGRYQTVWDATILKSSDEGETFDVIYRDASHQHIHGLHYDPYTNAIYAGVDGNPILIRTMDGGQTWDTIRTGTLADISVMVSTPTRRFFGGGATYHKGGYSLLMTDDDIDFTPILFTSETIQAMQVLGDKIYAFGCAYQTNQYAHIYEINLDGTDAKAIWCGPFDKLGSFNGYNHVRKPWMPNGSIEPQLLLGGDLYGEIRHVAGRLFNGSKHHQAVFSICIPDLPADGTTITIHSGNPKATTKSTDEIFNQIVHDGLIVRYKLDEGSGIGVFDSSGNGLHSSLIHTDGRGKWNAYGGRRAGGIYPYIIKGGASYRFSGGDYIDTPIVENLKKNFSVVCWLKDTSGDGQQHIIINKADGNTGWSLRTRGATPYQTLNYGNGNASAYLTTMGDLPCRDVWCMLGFVIDQSAIAKIRFIHNAKLFDPVTLDYDIADNGDIPIRIGAGATGSTAFIGDICDIQIYNRELTELEVQQLYEDRMLAMVEPKIIY